MIIWKPSLKVIYFFDPLGTDSKFVEDHFGQFGGRIDFVESAVQPKTSVICGEFCIFFLYEAVTQFDFSLEEVVNHCFSSDEEENERSVKDFMKKHELGSS